MHSCLRSELTPSWKWSLVLSAKQRREKGRRLRTWIQNVELQNKVGWGEQGRHIKPGSKMGEGGGGQPKQTPIAHVSKLLIKL